MTDKVTKEAPSVPSGNTDGNSVKGEENTNKKDGPLHKAEKHRELVNLRYPIDLGTDNIYKHLMRINIYKQKISKFETPTLGPNAFDDAKAGASKVYDVDAVLGGAALAVTGAGSKAASLVAKGLAASSAIRSGRSATAAAKAAQTAGQLAETLVNAAGKAVTGGVGVLGLAGKTLERKTVTEPIAYISLYMPETLIFTDRHDFDPVSVTEALGAIGTAEALVGGGGLTSGELAGRAAEAAGIAGPGIVDVSLFGEGYALNPQLEILYKGSKNRQFVFSFKFTPRNDIEAKSVESIIKTLRFHASPEYGEAANAARYFIPPSEFDIEFYIGPNQNKHLPRIAQCVLENIDVNYAAGGQYSTFVDGMPVEITMQLTFTETIILTKEDIDSGF
jgi:hypothetical protein